MSQEIAGVLETAVAGSIEQSSEEQEQGLTLQLPPSQALVACLQR